VGSKQKKSLEANMIRVRMGQMSRLEKLEKQHSIERKFIDIAKTMIDDELFYDILNMAKGE
jgi:hypothetical protein